MRNIGKYLLEHELGRGGMGMVWDAHDPTLQRRVAIKLMHGLGAGSSSRLARFTREAQAVARLQSPHVVRIYEYGITEEGEPYMVMELLEGESLGQRLKRARIMTPAALLPILTQIARGLEAAHEAGVVHCDLKPGNVFLAQHGAEVMVKILDFGVATVRSAPDDVPVDTTQPVDLVGTPPYMSPEQIRAENVDFRADLWSLAVVIYEALTGRLPFGSGDSSSVFLRICLDPFTPLPVVAPDLEPGFEAFFARALAKDPRARFGSARELVAAFAQLVREEVARPIHILVVDDEPDLVLLIEQCFERAIEDGRYRFFFAGNGLDGLQILREHPDVDIALTDLRMPGMDGLAFLGAIGDVAPALRAIVISAYSDMRNIRRAMNLGAFDFLVKPLDFADLESTIEKAAREVQTLRRALQSMEENDALRMFVDPAVREQLLPILRIAGCVSGERSDAAVAVMHIHARHAETPRGTIEHLNRVCDDLVSVVEAHEGSVARFLGDKVVTVFRGEDCHERAVAACLELARASTGQEVRMGVAAGRVVAGSVGAPSKRRFEYAVFGEPVHAADALAGAAGPGQILIQPGLAQALGTSISCDELTSTMEAGPEPAGRTLLRVTGVRRTRQRPWDELGTMAPELADTRSELRPGAGRQ